MKRIGHHPTEVGVGIEPSMILIGSRAAEKVGVKLKRQISKSDIDLIGDEADLRKFNNGQIKKTKFPGKYQIDFKETVIEFDATGNRSNQLLMGRCFDTTDIFGLSAYVPNPLDLFLIKRSHANFPVNFEKTINDLSAFKSHGISVSFEDAMKSEFFSARFEETKSRVGQNQKRIKLNKTNEQFFQGGESLRVYDHDDLHRCVSFYGQPMYSSCKKDLSMAKIERNLFEKMPLYQKVIMAQEEAMVIALERTYIPKRLMNVDLTITKDEALKIYRIGLFKVMRDLCKGWFQNFMIDNVDLLITPKWDFIMKFEFEYERGLLKLK